MHVAPVPILEARLRPVADSHAAELMQETAGRDHPLTVTPASMYHSAETYVRQLLSSTDTARHTGRDERRVFLSDLRGFRRRSFREIQRAMQTMSQFTPQIPKSRANAVSPLLGEIPHPESLWNSPADLPPIGSFPKPNQLADNYASRELSCGKWQTTPYNPYIVDGISDAPWQVPADDRTASSANRKADKQASKPGAQQLTFH